MCNDSPELEPKELRLMIPSLPAHTLSCAVSLLPSSLIIPLHLFSLFLPPSLSLHSLFFSPLSFPAWLLPFSFSPWPSPPACCALRAPHSEMSPVMFKTLAYDKEVYHKTVRKWHEITVRLEFTLPSYAKVNPTDQKFYTVAGSSSVLSVCLACLKPQFNAQDKGKTSLKN